jgi:hypothetical protein
MAKHRIVATEDQLTLLSKKLKIINCNLIEEFYDEFRSVRSFINFNLFLLQANHI